MRRVQALRASIASDLVATESIESSIKYKCCQTLDTDLCGTTQVNVSKAALRPRPQIQEHLHFKSSLDVPAPLARHAVLAMQIHSEEHANPRTRPETSAAILSQPHHKLARFTLQNTWRQLGWCVSQSQALLTHCLCSTAWSPGHRPRQANSGDWQRNALLLPLIAGLSIASSWPQNPQHDILMPSCTCKAVAHRRFSGLVNELWCAFPTPAITAFLPGSARLQTS